MPDSHIKSANASGATTPQPSSQASSATNSPALPPRPSTANVAAMQLAAQQQQQPPPQPQQPMWTPSGPVISGPVTGAAAPAYGSSAPYGSNRPTPQMTVSAPVWAVANAATNFRLGPHGSPHWSPVGGQKSFFPQNGSAAPFVVSQPMQQQQQFVPQNMQSPSQYGAQQQQQQRWQSPYASQPQFTSQSPAAAYTASPSTQPPPSAVRAPSIPIFSPTPLPPASAPSDASSQAPPLLSSVRKHEPPPMLSKPVLPSPSATASVAASAASYASPQSSAAGVSMPIALPVFSPMGGVEGREWQPHATPRAGTAGPDSRPFDQLLQLKKRGDARVCQLRIWADECVHGLQFFYESAEEGAGLIEGELAGVQLSSTGRPEVIRLDAGNAITAVGGRFNPNGVLEVLLIGTRRGAQRSFGGLGQAHPAGREFVLRIPAGHRVCGWFGSQNEEGFTSLGAYTGMPRKINSKANLDSTD